MLGEKDGVEQVGPRSRAGTGDGEEAGRGQTVDGEQAGGTGTADGEKQAASIPKQKRGFATTDKAKLHELAVKGGRQAHLNFTGHQFTSEEAREAGRKGGKVCAARKAAAKAAASR